MIFPGNQLLLTLPGVQVLATSEARSHVEAAVSGDVHWLNHGPRFVESTIRDKYHSDPLVMRLLDLYLENAPDGPAPLPSGAEPKMEPWPTN